MSDSVEKRGSRDIAIASLGQVLAAIWGLAIGGPGIAGAVASAALGPIGEQMMERVAAEWTRKSDVVAESALETAGLGPEEFCDILSGDPALIALAQKILWAASVSGMIASSRRSGHCSAEPWPAAATASTRLNFSSRAD